MTKPFPLIALALAAISLTPANHAFSPPITLASPSLLSSSPVVGDDRPPSTIVLQSQSSSAALENNQVQQNDNQTATAINLNQPPRKSLLQRILSIKSGTGNVATTSIRGDRYGTSNNSTILTPSDAAIKVGVKPTLEASKGTWKRAWKIHRFMMKVLHRFDGCRPKDSKLALACLWWKALSGNDPTSPVHDHQLSYDLLPPVTRWIVHRRLCRWYPRLHHANVEIRTAYLDKSVTNVINTIMSDTTPPLSNTTTTLLTPRKKIRLIVMGGGYDTRSMKLLERSLLQNNNNENTQQQSRRQKKKSSLLKNAFDNITSDDYDLECYELDLPEVVRAKRQLLQTRLFRRRPWLKEAAVDYPKLIPVNFNNLHDTRRALEEILVLPDKNINNYDDDSSGSVVGVTNIILFEGVMIYLDEGIPHSLLELCSTVLSKSNDMSSPSSSSSGYLCFADRLENIPGGDEDAANVEMERTGWELLDWLPKPGLARHMGVARLKRG